MEITEWIDAFQKKTTKKRVTQQPPRTDTCTNEKQSVVDVFEQEKKHDLEEISVCKKKWLKRRPNYRQIQSRKKSLRKKKKGPSRRARKFAAVLPCSHIIYYKYYYNMGALRVT